VADPADLKVAEGDPIQPGQLLADRGRERQRLEAQREQLQLAVERLQQSQITPPLPPAQPPPIAEPTYLEEQAAIERAQAVVTAAEWALANKRQEIAYLLELPNLDPLILEHEQAQLQQLQHDHTLAVRDYQLAMGRRSSVAYRHGVTRATAAAERNQAMLAYQQQWSEYEQRRRDKDYQLTQTQLKLDEIDYAISTLAVVRSPYAGRIRRVRWLGQKSDGRLGVELTLLVRDGAGAAVPGKPSVVPGAADGVGD
jgi:multidrug resistance efflux pump